MNLDPAAMAQLSTGGPAAYRIAADWFLERGDARGEFILDELVLAERPNPSTRRAVLQRRAERSALFPKLEAPLRALGVTECDYHWGFVQFVRLPEQALASLPQLLELEPISQLAVELADGAGLARAMKTPAFGRIRALTLESARAPALSSAGPGIDTLTLRADASTILRVGDLFPSLKHLHLSGGSGGEAAVSALASGRLALEQLWAPGCGVTSSSVSALAKSSRPVRALGLANNELSSSALQALGASQGLSALYELDLRARFAPGGFLSTGLPALKKLRVTRPSARDRQLYASRGISLY